MTTTLDWRSMPTATNLTPFERDMLYLREQGRTPTEIATLLRVPLRIVSPALTVAVRRLGFSGIKELVAQCGWPSVYRAHRPAQEDEVVTREELLSVQGGTVQKKRDVEDRHVAFSVGMKVHVHTASGLTRGTVKAFASDMVLLADGSEVQRSRVHVGEECA